MNGLSRMDNDTPGIEVDLNQRAPSPSAFVGINHTCIGTGGAIIVKSIAVQQPSDGRLKFAPDNSRLSTFRLEKKIHKP